MDNQPIASISLFHTLVNDGKSELDLIEEFLSSILRDWCGKDFTQFELTKSVNKKFGFNLPVSIVEYVLQKRLKKSRKVSYKKGNYCVLNISDGDAFNEELTTSMSDVSLLTDDIERFIVDRRGVSQIVKNDLESSITEFLLGNGREEKYIDDVALYFSKDHKDFKNIIERIKLGGILYKGITYNNHIGTDSSVSLSRNLNIFLETDVIFDMMGYNGDVYKEIFNDFIGLINEYNSKSTKNRNNKVCLFYTPQTSEEIDLYFKNAEYHKAHHKPTRIGSAVEYLNNKCSQISELKIERGLLDRTLEKYKIKIYQERYHIQENNLDSSYYDSAVSILSKFEDKEEVEVDQKVDKYLKIARYAHSRRREERVPCSLDGCDFVILSENARIDKISKLFLRPDEFKLAVRFDYLITYFWFKLQKSFSPGIKVPSSLDFYFKSEIILRNKISQKITAQYDEQLKKFKAGEMTHDELIADISVLKGVMDDNAKITPSVYDSALNITDRQLVERREYVNKVKSENEILSDQIKTVKAEKDEAEFVANVWRRKFEEVEESKRKERANRNKKTEKLKSKLRIWGFTLSCILFWVICLVLFLVLVLLCYYGVSASKLLKGDVWITVVSFFISALISVSLGGLFKKFKKQEVNKNIKKIRDILPNNLFVVMVKNKYLK